MDNIIQHLNELDVIYHQPDSDTIYIYQTDNQSDFFAAVELLAANGARVTLAGTIPNLKAKGAFSKII